MISNAETDAADTSPVPFPSPDADAVADAARNLLLKAMMSPLAQKAFLDGLRTPDLHERRLWWQMALEFGIGPQRQEAEGGTKIVFQNVLPGPKHEDGPIGAHEPAPLPGRITGSDRAARTGS